ncbi:MAG TPA: hypothetical protein VGQ00_00140 [Candidatus Norongarragalinales archaeon]|jgi:hypothetical protein|nr:hypothetical protein [Candidatus Norongarragalinales archaeon]
MDQWKRAFIAAPLLGTLIFAAAVLFSVNLSRTDNTEVSQVVGDAFHNRIVSLLDIYRSDLGSLFRTALTRNIEFFLASPGWMSNAFQLPYTETGYVGSQQQQGGVSTACARNDIKCQRVAGCKALSDLIHQSVCPADSEYGVNKWLTIVGRNQTFEGITFSAANPESFGEFINPQTGLQLCQILIPGSVFDCDAFGNGDLQCRDPETRQVLPLCEKGTFYVKIKATDPEIFPKLPRVLATDSAGNIVRSGAISDEDFYLPITYPFFLYFNMSMIFYEKLKVLETPGGYCVAVAGPPQGSCAAKGYNAQFGLAQDDDNARGFLAQVVYDNAVKPACEKAISVLPAGQLSAEIDVGKNTNDGFVDCLSDGAEVRQWIAQNALDPQISKQSGCGATNDASCFVFTRFGGQGVRVRFIDHRPEYQVDPSRLNRYVFHADPRFPAPSQ